MEHETNIVDIVRSRRYITAALKFLLKKEKRLMLQERSNYYLIDPDCSDPVSDSPTDSFLDSSGSQINNS